MVLYLRVKLQIFSTLNELKMCLDICGRLNYLGLVSMCGSICY